MPRNAVNLLRQALHYRRDAFDEGLRAAGFRLVRQVSQPTPDDVLVIWNRYAGFAVEAARFERAGAAVLVVENGPLGKQWRGGEWFSLARGFPALCGGSWPAGGPLRWERFGASLSPWVEGGREVLILAQRGIGAPGFASPPHWAEDTQRRIGGRVRAHPGTGAPARALEADLADAARVVTWASGAALLALQAGVPVFNASPDWAGASAARPLSEWGREPLRDDAARRAMFERLAWAMWTLDEVRTGEPVRRLVTTT